MIQILNETILITAFVVMMMVVIEYVNVATQGKWLERLSKFRMGQYFIGALLGALPGCLGSFAAVTMYSHRVLTLGAVVATMISTSGDESFVMFAMFPERALLITVILFVIGVLAGALTDLLGKTYPMVVQDCQTGLEVHAGHDISLRFSFRTFLEQWKNCSAFRATLTAALLLVTFGIATGQIGEPELGWITATLLVISLFALFIVATVPDHFLEDHLWKHVAREHVLRVFLWTLGALVLLYFMSDNLFVREWMRDKTWQLLAVASLIGIIPESGPHLIFVTMFAQGLIPMSILLANSIVQDGHGMLPMLAHSRKTFLVVKLINLAVGLTVGAALLAAGY
ncbi:MAG: arsenic efflux protein [Chlorobiales bacterium]|jgi:hypothetical protein|nr:arsenic efflux protein [Chlorobiales bacterium]